MNGDDADSTTKALCEALDALADTVRAEPTGYSAALRAWRRREYRRRLILTALIVLVFAITTLIGLWVLDHDAGTPHDLFGVAQAMAERVSALYEL